MGTKLGSLTSWEEHRLSLFENRLLRRIFGPKRVEVTGDKRKMHNEKLHNLHSTPNSIIMTKSFGITTDYDLEDPVRFPVGPRFFSSPQCPYWFWGSPSSLSSEYRGLFPRESSDHSPPSKAEVKNGGAIPPLPVHLQGIVLNYFSTWTNFIF
jgi:hypothetical protein